MKNKLLDDCFLHDRDRLSHDDAIALLESRVGCVVEPEAVALRDGVGRLLAGPVVASHPVPAHTNSAVDGYAFNASLLQSGADLELPVAGRSAAGHPFAGTVAEGLSVRIYTGAVMPEGCDTVVMQEDTELVEQDGQPRVRIPKGLKPGANVRNAGEDVATGEQLFDTGHLIRPQDLAALASIGVSTCNCFKRLRIGVVSTGDEVIVAGKRALKPGEVYDANAPMLIALAALVGAEVSDLGIWPDDLQHVCERLQSAAETYDVVLTSGGASRGDEDHMLSALDTLGTRHMWQLAIKPGRPLMFGQIEGTAVVGLPGNPVAVFVCFLMYVYPLLRRLSGAAWPHPRRFMLPAHGFTIKKRKTGRREFWRAMLVQTPDGMAVEKFARDGSGLITGLRSADGLIDVPENIEKVLPGDLVSFIPFSEFGILGR